MLIGVIFVCEGNELVLLRRVAFGDPKNPREAFDANKVTVTSPAPN